LGPRVKNSGREKVSPEKKKKKIMPKRRIAGPKPLEPSKGENVPLKMRIAA
jgi:hypothetical protein